MKKVIYIVLFGLIFSSCNLKKLGCIKCGHRRKTSIDKYDNGQVKQITKKHSISRNATDTSVKSVIKTFKYDENGELTYRSKSISYHSVWHFDMVDNRKREIFFHPDSSLSKTIKVYKDNKLIKNK